MTENDRLDDEADDMQERSERLRREISGVREDWERKKADDSLPGAAGEATGDASQGTGAPPPEATKPG